MTQGLSIYGLKYGADRRQNRREQHLAMTGCILMGPMVFVSNF